MSNVETLVDISLQYESLEEFYTQIALFSGETKSDKDIIKNGVKILTIHSSKGLEYEHIFLPFWN
jgi:DNA helicase-2/ATP-dependent DNA helicase PcrA